MAVVVNVGLAGDSVFIPFAQRTRGGHEGSSPVATLDVGGDATGAAGGGTVTINIRMGRNSFGFKPLLVPIFIGLEDTLAAVGPIQAIWRSAGNRRLIDDVTQVVTTVRVNALNAALVQTSGMLIDPDAVVEDNVLSAVWPTNTDGLFYHCHALFAVYDAELIEKYGEIKGLLEGLT